jgi:hypothetical protein
MKQRFFILSMISTMGSTHSGAALPGNLFAMTMGLLLLRKLKDTFFLPVRLATVSPCPGRR